MRKLAHFGDRLGVLARRSVGGRNNRVRLRHLRPKRNDVFERRLNLVEKRSVARNNRLLRQVADRRVFGLCNFARIGVFLPAQNLQKRALARAVRPDKPYAVALVDNRVYSVENRPRTERKFDVSKLYH